MKIIVDENRITENLQAIQAKYRKDILLVVKNNAYNMGLETTIHAAQKANVTHFMVTEIESAKAIRKISETAYILVMRALTQDELEVCKQYRFATIIPSLKWYEENKQQLDHIDLHLKINVGMNRFGVCSIEEAVEITKSCQTNNHALVGLSTHFPLADEDDLEEHNKQVDFFVSVYNVLKAKNTFEIVHAENSATLMQQDQRLAFCHFARVGILAYGYSPTTKYSWLKPALFVFATVLDVKTLKQGDYLGYGTTYVAESDERIAVLDIGYGDGLIRKRNELPAYIGEKAYPFAGRISMSHAYLRVDEYVKTGDNVEIFGDHTPVDLLMRETAGVANSEIMSYLRIERSENNGK